MSEYRLDYLEQLETESIHIFREIAGQFERPVLLFSGGKDSITLVHLAKKAFAPGKIPFPLMHIDTGHNFPEALEFRDLLVEQVGATLIVRKEEDTIKQKNLTEPKGKFASRNWLQTYTLIDVIEEMKCDVCFGGGRNVAHKDRSGHHAGLVIKETKKRQWLRIEFFQCAMNLDNGTQNFNDQRFGVFTTDEFTRVRMFVHSLSATGQN